MKNTRSYPLSDKSYFGLDLQVAFFVFRVPPSCFAAATLGCGLSCLWRFFCSNGTPVSLISAGRPFIFSFIHVQSGEKFGTRKKRKEDMRKATDVETKIHSFIHIQSGRKRGIRKKKSFIHSVSQSVTFDSKNYRNGQPQKGGPGHAGTPNPLTLTLFI